MGDLSAELAKTWATDGDFVSLAKNLCGDDASVVDVADLVLGDDNPIAKAAKDWDPKKHPRNDQGKFKSSGVTNMALLGISGAALALGGKYAGGAFAAARNAHTAGFQAGRAKDAAQFMENIAGKVAGAGDAVKLDLASLTKHIEDLKAHGVAYSDEQAQALLDAPANASAFADLAAEHAKVFSSAAEEQRALVSQYLKVRNKAARTMVGNAIKATAAGTVSSVAGETFRERVGKALDQEIAKFGVGNAGIGTLALNSLGGATNVYVGNKANQKAKDHELQYRPGLGALSRVGEVGGALQGTAELVGGAAMLRGGRSKAGGILMGAGAMDMLGAYGLGRYAHAQGVVADRQGRGKGLGMYRDAQDVAVSAAGQANKGNYMDAAHTFAGSPQAPQRPSFLQRMGQALHSNAKEAGGTPGDKNHWDDWFREHPEKKDEYKSHLRKALNFDEKKHKRDDKGRFAAGVVGGAITGMGLGVAGTTEVARRLADGLATNGEHDASVFADSAKDYREAEMKNLDRLKRGGASVDEMAHHGFVAEQIAGSKDLAAETIRTHADLLRDASKVAVQTRNIELVAAGLGATGLAMLIHDDKKKNRSVKFLVDVDDKTGKVTIVDNKAKLKKALDRAIDNHVQKFVPGPIGGGIAGATGALDAHYAYEGYQADKYGLRPGQSTHGKQTATKLKMGAFGAMGAGEAALGARALMAGTPTGAALYGIGAAGEALAVYGLGKYLKAQKEANTGTDRLTSREAGEEANDTDHWDNWFAEHPEKRKEYQDNYLGKRLNGIWDEKKHPRGFGGKWKPKSKAEVKAMSDKELVRYARERKRAALPGTAAMLGGLYGGMGGTIIASTKGEKAALAAAKHAKARENLHRYMGEVVNRHFGDLSKITVEEKARAKTLYHLYDAHGAEAERLAMQSRYIGRGAQTAGVAGLVGGLIYATSHEDKNARKEYNHRLFRRYSDIDRAYKEVKAEDKQAKLKKNYTVSHPDVEWIGTFSKIDTDKRQVFGWASVAKIDGNLVVDRQGDLIEPDEMEKAAYDYVMNSRVGGDMHKRVTKSGEDAPHHVADMIESIVFTPEKIAKLGLPAGSLPTGWWVGFKVHDDAAWAEVKKGNRKGFSIHGRGKRVEKSLDSIDKS